jgi:hypothetical protein
MNVPVSELRQIISNIKNIILELDRRQIFGQEKRENYFFKNHSDIMNTYPFLVSMLCSGEDSSMLDIMLRHKEEIETGERSAVEVDEIVGEKISDSFLKLTPVNDNK